MRGFHGLKIHSEMFKAFLRYHWHQDAEKGERMAEAIRELNTKVIVRLALAMLEGRGRWSLDYCFK